MNEYLKFIFIFLFLENTRNNLNNKLRITNINHIIYYFKDTLHK